MNVNGRSASDTVTTLEPPNEIQAPWELDFDFGETATARRVKVQAENASGKTAQAEITTRTPKSDIEVVIRSPRDSMVTGEQTIDVEAVSSSESPLVTLLVAVDGVEVYACEHGDGKERSGENRR